jgi:glutamate decarboxylase
MLDTFRHTEDLEQIQALVNKVCQNYIEADHVTTPNVTEDDLAARFKQMDMPQEPVTIKSYFDDLVKNVVVDGVHTSCPQMVGHMTSALPTHIPVLAKLIAAMNQNVVKVETAKTTTFLERETMGQLHKLLYGLPEAFYEEHVQNPASMLALFTSGGTLANTSALWVARNRSLPPSEDGTFKGVEYEGLVPSMIHHGYKDSMIIGSALMHYSLDKATDVLGVGVNGLVKIPVDENYRVDIQQMEDKILWARENNVLIMAMIGICGTTETGAIDSLSEMAQLAKKYNIHFHVDAAWGGPCIFSQKHRFKASGIELADSVTLDAHKQMWLPMGAGMVFFKDPHAAEAVRKSANYIIRKESNDLGKFTIDGSRAANAVYLHANMQVLGLRGFEVLFDLTVRTTRYMARRIMQSTNFELLVKPMTNILLYRWVPFSLREKYFNRQLTDEDNDFIDECNRKLQDIQKLQGKTFVSRTTIKCPLYDHRPVVGLRVVIGNPLTTEADIDAVFEHQNEIINSGELTDSFDQASPEAIILRKGVGLETPDNASSKITLDYWTRLWENMSDAERFIYNHSIEEFVDSLITPDCLVTDPGLPAAEAMKVGMAQVLSERARIEIPFDPAMVLPDQAEQQSADGLTESPKEFVKLQVAKGMAKESEGAMSEVAR